jgi:hypothetical protein
VTRIDLRKRDIACLGRLIRGPLEIGAIPEETVERLVDRGLVVQVLGSCEITGSGQLTYHRQQFLRAPRSRAVSARRNTPSYMQHTRHGAHQRGSRLGGVHAIRRKLDARIRQASELPHLLIRMATETAGQIRSIQLNNANWRGGNTQEDNKTD